MWSLLPVGTPLCIDSSTTQRCWCNDVCREQKAVHIHQHLKTNKTLHASSSKIKNIGIYQQILNLKTSNNQCCLVDLLHVTHLHRQLHWERACIQLDRHTEPPRPHPRTHGYSHHCSVSSFSLYGTKNSMTDAEGRSSPSPELILSNEYC